MSLRFSDSPSLHPPPRPAGYVLFADHSPAYLFTPRTGPPPSPSQSIHSSACRRAKIDKIRRTLGEDVPINLVAPTSDDAPPCSSYSHSRSKSHSHQSRNHVTSSSAPPMKPGLEALFQVLASPAVVRAHRRAGVVASSSSRRREQMRAIDDAGRSG